VERLKYYMMCSVKKPVRVTVRQHVCRMETLNKYLGMLPTIKNSPMAVDSMELGNVPFTKTTYASIILSHLPVAWRNKYDLMHKIVPESPRAMLLAILVLSIFNSDDFMLFVREGLVVEVTGLYFVA
jgi:hypothetical protein